MLKVISEAAALSDAQMAEYAQTKAREYYELRSIWVGMGLVTDLYNLAVWIQRQIGPPIAEPKFGEAEHISDEDVLEMEMEHIEIITEWVEEQFAAE